MNNDKFRNSFKKRIDKTKNKLGEYVTQLTVDIDARLVFKSPVDTGRFKGNWVVGDGRINTATTESTAPSNNEAKIKSIKINGQIIYITNSLEYAATLEYGRYGTGAGATVKTTRDGYSIQAPYGMVRLTMTELSSIAKQIGAELKLV